MTSNRKEWRCWMYQYYMCISARAEYVEHWPSEAKTLLQELNLNDNYLKEIPVPWSYVLCKPAGFHWLLKGFSASTTRKFMIHDSWWQIHSDRPGILFFLKSLMDEIYEGNYWCDLGHEIFRETVEDRQGAIYKGPSLCIFKQLCQAEISLKIKPSNVLHP